MTHKWRLLNVRNVLCPIACGLAYFITLKILNSTRPEIAEFFIGVNK
nr:MAG TPA: hypothetical protein [Caudoviricetes sp.]